MGGGARRVGAAGAPAATTSIPNFEPETALERRLSSDAELAAGLAWGEPRAGHPEGSVARHVGQLLRTIDEWGETGERRAELRLLAIVHDALKYRVDHSRPKTGDNHHAVRARRFAERHTSDERLLATIELHDRPYALWRRLDRTGELQEDELERMLERIPDPALFLRFVELDGSTPGKDPEPIRWLRGELKRRGLVAAMDPPS